MKMKRFLALFLCLTMLLSLLPAVASADDAGYYLVGTFKDNGWTIDAQYKFSEINSSGIYKLNITFDGSDNSKQFKVVHYNGSSIDDWDSYTPTNYSIDDWYCEYTESIYLNPTGSEKVWAGPKDDGYYLIGTMTSTTWGNGIKSTYKLTRFEGSDNIYYVDLSASDMPTGKEFKGAHVTNGKVDELHDGGAYGSYISGDTRVYFYPNGGMSGEGWNGYEKQVAAADTANDGKYYIVGGFNEWTINSSYEMTKVGDEYKLVNKAVELDSSVNEYRMFKAVRSIGGVREFWSATNQELAETASGTYHYTFTYTPGSNPTATRLYPVTIQDQLFGGSITADKEYAAPGETVTITATPLSNRFSFCRLIVNNEQKLDDELTFEMPNGTATVSAVFGPVDEDYAQLGWDVEGGHGSLSLEVGGVTLGWMSTVPSGTVVTVVATPEDGYCLDTVSVVYYETTASIATVMDGQFTMPTLNEKGPDVRVKATFVEIPATKYDVSLTQPSEGGTIAADKTEAASGEKVTITPIPDAGYEFSCIKVNGVSQGSGVTKFDMPGNPVTVTAEFTKIQYSVSTSVPTGHGSITVYKGQDELNGESALYVGDSLTFIVSPDTGYHLVANSIACTYGENQTVSFNLIGGPYQVTMPAGDLTISAQFAQTDYTISVTQPAAGGTVTVNDQTSLTYTAAGTYRIDAIPAAGYELISISAGSHTWYPTDNPGDARYNSSNGGYYVDWAIGANELQDYTVTATFNRLPQYLYVWTNPVGFFTDDYTPGTGTVTVTANGENVQIDDYYMCAIQPGATVAITATADEGCEVWKLVYGDAYTKYTVPFVMPNAEVAVRVVFAKVDYEINVTQPANGTVGVSGNADTANYGDTVTLTNNPAEGYQFVSYTVTNTATSEAIVVANGQFTMPAAPVTVTATFEEIPPALEDGYYLVGDPLGLGWNCATANKLTHLDGTVYYIDITVPDNPENEGNYSKYKVKQVSNGTESFIWDDADYWILAGTRRVYFDTNHGYDGSAHGGAGYMNAVERFPGIEDGYYLVGGIAVNGNTTWTPLAANKLIDGTITKEVTYNPAPQGLSENDTNEYNDYKVVQVADTVITGWYPNGSPNPVLANNGTEQTAQHRFTFANDTVTDAILYSVTASAANNGTLEVDKALAASGETVTITATPSNGYRLATLTVTGPDGEVQVDNNQFTMPAGAVTVAATFEQLSTDAPLLFSANLSLDGNIGVNFKIVLQGDVQASDVTAEFYLGDATSPAKTVLLSTLTLTDGKYVVGYSLPARLINQSLTLKVKVGNDYALVSATEDYSDGYTTSIVKCCNAYISGDFDQPVKDLAQALLNYGGYADWYLNEGTTALPTYATAVEQNDENPFALIKIKSKSLPVGLALKSVFLSLESETELNLILEVSGVHTADEYHFYLGGQELTKTVEGDTVTVKIRGIAAKDLDERQVVTVKIGNEAVGSVEVSALYYGKLVLRAQTAGGSAVANIDVLADLMKALYQYNAKANDYFVYLGA